MIELIVSAVIGVPLLLYFYLTWHYNHWKKLKVPYINPRLVYGNMEDIFLGKENAGIVYDNFYWEYPTEPIIGLYKLRTPQLMIRDIDVAKKILIKEFNNFHDNDITIDAKVDPIMGVNPFVAKGDSWKSIRSIHTQNLTSAKIKNMFNMMKQVTEDMKEFVMKNSNKPIDAKYFSGQFTTDVVGSCVYGLRTNSFLNPDAEFRKISNKMLSHEGMSKLAFILFSICPSIAALLRIRLIPKKTIDFFMKIIEDIYELKTKIQGSGNDYLQLLINENKQREIPMSIEEITGHTITFFIEGYETSSILMGFIIYILSVHSEVQKKLRDEIRAEKELNYETINKLMYLDAVVNETLRLYNPGTRLVRQCNKDTEINTTKKSILINKGVTIIVPIYSIHRDPAYFFEPDDFKPDRFFDDPSLKNASYFFPFGMGPRACLGSRFALTQVKTGVAHLIKDFLILPTVENPKMPEINPKSPILLLPKDTLYVQFQPVDVQFQPVA